MQRYQFKVTNLDCAMCAKSIEDKLNSLDWIEQASLNFSTEKLVVVTERTDGVFDDVKKVAKAVEPESIVTPFEQLAKVEPTKKKVSWYLPFFVVGFAFGLAGVLLDYLSDMRTLAYVFMWIGAAFMLTKTLKNAALKLVRSHSVDENLLVSISVVGALAIGEGMEGLMVIVLYQIGKFFEAKAVDKTRNSVKSLVLVKPETVLEKINDDYVETPIDEVKVGAIISVKPGDIIPLDGIIQSGNSSLNMASLTGESVPVEVSEGDVVTSGAVCLDGVLEIKTTGLDSDSTLTKIMSLIETASERKAKSETVVTRAVKYYVPAVIICAAVVALAFGLSGTGIENSLYKGMIFLVVSCPCAVAISVPLTYFCGLGNASQKGILIKGTNFLDNISNVTTIAFDKTGTITSGDFSVVDVEIKNQYYTRDEVLKLCYFGERNSSHPIAKAIVNFATPHIAEYNDDPVQPENYHEQAGTGVSYVLDGELISVGKSKNASDNAKTSVSLYVNNEEIAVVYLADTIKENTANAIAYFKSKGIKTEMLTGDNDAVAKSVATEIGIESYRASMLPEDKFAEIENVISQKQKKTDTVVFVGDGINDAPVLGRADIGIAMGLSGSAATVDTADVVLMNDDLSQLVTLHKLSKRTRRIVSENVIATLVIKLTFVILGLCSVTGLAWAVFADVGLTCCTVFNSLRALKYNPKK